MMAEVLILAFVVFAVVLVYDYFTYDAPTRTSAGDRRHEEALEILQDARAIHDVVAATLAQMYREVEAVDSQRKEK